MWCCADPVQLIKCQIRKWTTSLFSSTQLRTHIQYSLALIGNRGDKNFGSINSPVIPPPSLPSFLPPICPSPLCQERAVAGSGGLVFCICWHIPNFITPSATGSSLGIQERCRKTPCTTLELWEIMSSPVCLVGRQEPLHHSLPFLVQNTDPTHPPVLWLKPLDLALFFRKT